MASSASPRLYLDHAATSPLHPAAAAELAASWRPRDPARARARLAEALQLPPERVIPTLGGSEGNARALQALWRLAIRRGRRLLVSQRSEHPSLLAALEVAAEAGARLAWLPLDPGGRVDVHALPPDAELGAVSVMAANHETGALQPQALLWESCQARGVPLHRDAVQALRYMAPSDLAGDLLTLGGHKLGGPRGVGALLLGPEAERYGLDERALLGPSPPPRSLEALAAALEARPPAPAPDLAASRDALEAELLAALPQLEINGPREPRSRLPGHLSCTLPGLSGESLVLELDLAGIAVSSGAACASAAPGPSPVLLALGKTRAQATGSLRLSLGGPLDPSQRARVVQALTQAARRLQSLAD